MITNNIILVCLEKLNFQKGNSLIISSKEADGEGKLVHFSFSLELIVIIEAFPAFILHDNVDFKIYLVSFLLSASSLSWLPYNLVGVNF